MTFARKIAPLSLAATLIGLTPAAAHAQWSFQAYFGGNHTQAADIEIHQPSLGTDLTYRHVSFEAKPLEAPQYYGYRFGHVGGLGSLALEFEFLHMKAYADTGMPAQVDGKVAGVAVSTTERMDAKVARYSMSHGLNFILVNVAWRRPLTGMPATFVVRSGLGPTLPHGESVVFGDAQEGYEWGGLGGQAAAGLDVHLAGRLSAVLEYKLTFAKPTITIAGGTGQTTALTHHLAIGIGVVLGGR
jgi:hypothetical protein